MGHFLVQGWFLAAVCLQTGLAWTPIPQAIEPSSEPTLAPSSTPVAGHHHHHHHWTYPSRPLPSRAPCRARSSSAIPSSSATPSSKAIASSSIVVVVASSSAIVSSLPTPAPHTRPIHSASPLPQGSTRRPLTRPSSSIASSAIISTPVGAASTPIVNTLVQSGVISTPVGAASTPLAHTIVPSAPSSVPFVSPQSSGSSPQGTTVGSQGGASASIPVAGTSAVLSAPSTIGQGSSQSTALSPNGATTKLGSTGPQDSSFAAVVTSTPTLSGAAQSTVSSGFSTLDLTTSTVLSTRTATITACPTTVPNCPATAKTTFVTTETIVVSTTICPVIEAADATKTPPNPASITGSSENGKGNNSSDLTTSTVYSTRTATITACPSSVTNCPLRSKTTYLTTETLVVSTTICPVSEATATGASATAKQTSPVVTGMSGNGADSELTTSTVYATHTATVLACPESVADCPLRSKTLSATTQTVAVATTVYSVDFVHTTVPGGSGAGAGSGFNSGYNSGIDSNSGSSSSSSSAGNANAVSNAGSGAEAVHTTTIAVESCSDDNTCTGYINTILMTQTSTAQSTAAPTPFKPHWSTSVGSNTVSVPSSQSSGMTTTTISATTGAVSPVYTGAASAQIKQSFKLVLGTAMAVFVAVLV